MSTTNQFNRNNVKSFTLKVGPTNNGIDNAVTAKLGHQAQILGVHPVSVEAFDGTGTVTVTATDGTTSFVTAQNVKDAVGIETAAATAKAYPTGGTFKAYITDQNGNSVNGEAWITVVYVETAGGNEVFG